MGNQLHNPFKPGDLVVLDRPAKATFLQAPDGRDAHTEMFWLEQPIRGWHEITGVSRQVTAANLEKMIAAGLVKQFGGEPAGDEPAEWPTSRTSLEFDNPEDPRRLTLLGGAVPDEIRIDIWQTNHGTWGARLMAAETELYEGDTHKKQGVVLYKTAAAARALAADLTRFAELVEDHAAQRNLETR